MHHRQHWESIYKEHESDEVSWFQKHPQLSLEWILETDLPANSSIIDVGGGDSRLVDELLANGYGNITVLDISMNALSKAAARLGKHASAVQWLMADILEVNLPAAVYDLWHDRAVFHFLLSIDHRKTYIRKMLHALKPHGRIIMATFAEDGPEKCSGLPVMRYSARGLHAELGHSVQLLRHKYETHVTPAGNQQKFIYCEFLKVTDTHSGESS